MKKTISKLIKEQLDFETYYRRLIPADKIKKRTGNNVECHCPLGEHEDRDPSFYFNIDTGTFFCHSCKKSGDSVDFYMALYGHDKKTAMQEIKETFGLKETLEFENTPPEKKKTQKTQEKNQLRILSSNEIEKLCNDLSPREIEYLNGRKISDQVIKKFKIGFDKKKNKITIPMYKDGQFSNLKEFNTNPKAKPKAKNAFGHKVQIFPDVNEEEEHVIIFEGEWDVLSAISGGLHAVTGTGGASSGIPKSEIGQFKGKTVYLCYDIDKEGQTALKNDIKKLTGVAKEIYTIYLPLDIKKYPRGDFNDYIVKEEKTLEDFMKLVDAAELIEEKVEIAPEKAEEKSIVEDDGKYCRVKYVKGERTLKPISNFVIKNKHNVLRTNVESGELEIDRCVYFISDNGKKSGASDMRPSQTSDLKSFRKFCHGRGDHIFKGTSKDLEDVFEMICESGDGKIVKELQMIGENKKDGVWYLRPYATKGESFLERDEDGIFWNGKYGYKLTKDLESQCPDFCGFEMYKDEADSIERAQQFAEVLVDSLGGENYISLAGVAATAGCIYFQEFVDAMGFFPIIFIGGTKRSGKTKYLELMSNLVGLPMRNKLTETCNSVTPGGVTVSRKLATIAGISLKYDEMRNDKKSHMIADRLRGAYNAIGRTTGKKEGRGVNIDPVFTSVQIAGEMIVNDEAFITRTIGNILDELSIRSEFKSKVIEKSIKASARILYLITHKNKKTAKRVIEKTNWYADKIKNEWCPQADVRITETWAGILSFYIVLFSPEDKTLENYIKRNGVTSISSESEYLDESERNLSSPTKTFIERFSLMVEEGRLNGIGWGKIEENMFYFACGTAFISYQKEWQNKDDNLATKNLIATELKNISGFTPSPQNGTRKSHVMKILGKSKSVYIFDATEGKMPTMFKRLIDLVPRTCRDDKEEEYEYEKIEREAEESRQKVLPMRR